MRDEKSIRNSHSRCSFRSEFWNWGIEWLKNWIKSDWILIQNGHLDLPIWCSSCSWPVLYFFPASIKSQPNRMGKRNCCKVHKRFFKATLQQSFFFFFGAWCWFSMEPRCLWLWVSIYVIPILLIWIGIIFNRLWLYMNLERNNFISLAPTGALIVMIVYYTSYKSLTFHSVHRCNWCYKSH